MMDPESRASTGGIAGWLQERTRLGNILDFLAEKKVPRHNKSFWYMLGGLAFFFFCVQIVSGILLALYYSPTPDTANSSVQFIVHIVPMGWLVRSIHSWSSHLMVAFVLLHMTSVYFLKSYRRPREIMWFSGAVLLFLVFGFAFTGYLLPWDSTAYFATQIGTEIPRSIPLVGELIVNILRGGDFIAEESLKRLFALHAIILPLITLVVVAFHLILNQVHGPSIPIGARTKEPAIPFYPNYMYRDAIAWSFAIILLAMLSLFAPVAVGPKANAFASAPAGIKPEWYFLPLFETLRLFPAELWGLNGEMLVNVGVGLFGSLLLLVPVLDRKAARGERSVLFQWVGIVTISYLCVSIFLAYLT